MVKIGFLLAVAVPALGACSKSPDPQNVADTSNSAGAALERSVNELDATTETMPDNAAASNAAVNNSSATNAPASNGTADNAANVAR